MFSQRHTNETAHTTLCSWLTVYVNWAMLLAMSWQSFGSCWLWKTLKQKRLEQNGDTSKGIFIFDLGFGFVLFFLEIFDAEGRPFSNCKRCELQRCCAFVLFWIDQNSELSMATPSKSRRTGKSDAVQMVSFSRQIDLSICQSNVFATIVLPILEHQPNIAPVVVYFWWKHLFENFKSVVVGIFK